MLTALNDDQYPNLGPQTQVSTLLKPESDGEQPVLDDVEAKHARLVRFARTPVWSMSDTNNR